MTDEDLRWLRSEFERCAPWIQDALDRDIGAFELEDIWDCLARPKSQTQLWPMKRSVIVTVVEIFPRKTVLRYWLAGGKLEECLAERERIESWAKTAGAEIAVIGGRKGWLKFMPDFQQTAVFMTKAL